MGRCVNWRRPEPARSSTSSTSCKRTAASTISSRAIPGAYTVSSGKNSKGRDDRAEAGEPGVISTSSTTRRRRCSQRATEPASCPGTKCRMDGFDQEWFGGEHPGSSIRSTSTCRTTSRSRTSTWRTNGCWPTTCSSRSSTRASSRISTSSPRRRSRASTCPTVRGAASRDRATTSRRSRTIARTDRRSYRASTIKRSATSSTTAQLSWRFYTSWYGSAVERIRRGLVELSGGQTHLRRARLGEASSTPQKTFLTDVPAGKLASFTWITPICDDSDHIELRRRIRTVVGHVARQRGRREQVLGFDGDLRAVGRLGRSVRSRRAAV